MENGVNCHGKVMEFYYQILVGTLYIVSYFGSNYGGSERISPMVQAETRPIGCLA